MAVDQGNTRRVLPRKPHEISATIPLQKKFVGKRDNGQFRALDRFHFWYTPSNSTGRGRSANERPHRANFDQGKVKVKMV
jgi:hypothetical protein